MSLDSLSTLTAHVTLLTEYSWGSRIPPRDPTQPQRRPNGRIVFASGAHVGSCFVIFSRLRRILDVLGSSWACSCVLRANFFDFGSLSDGFGKVLGRVWVVEPAFFDVFSCMWA